MSADLIKVMHRCPTGASGLVYTAGGDVATWWAFGRPVEIRLICHDQDFVAWDRRMAIAVIRQRLRELGAGDLGDD